MSKRATRGMIWLALAALASRGLGFVSTIIFTHLMGRDEYGRANAAYTLACTMTTLSQLMNYGEVLRRKERFEDACTLGVSISSAMVLILVTLALIFAAPIMRMVNADGSQSLLRVAVLISLFGVLLVMGEVLLYRRLRFGTWSILEFTGTSSMVGSAVLLTLRGWGSMAVIIGQVLREAFIRITSTALSGLRWVRRPHWDWPLLKAILGYGLPIYFSGVLNMISTTWDNLFIGRVLGMEALGAYAVAYALAYIPIYTISERICLVFFSVVAQFHDDIERRQRAFLRSLSAVMLVVTPLVTLLLICGPRVVAILFSKKWAPTVAPLVTALSLVGVGLTLQTITNFYFGAIGRTLAIIAVTALRVAVMFSALFFFGRQFVVHAGWAVSCSFLATGVFACLLLSAIDSIPLGLIFRQLAPSAIGGALMAGAIYALDRILPLRSNWALLVIEAAAGCVTYLVYQALFHRERLMDIILSVLGRRKAASE